MTEQNARLFIEVIKAQCEDDIRYVIERVDSEDEEYIPIILYNEHHMKVWDKDAAQVIMGMINSSYRKARNIFEQQTQ